MITNKTALLATDIIGKDKNQAMLANIHFTAEGTAIVCNGKTILAIESVDEERKENIPFEGTGKEIKGEITVPLDLIQPVIKSIPVDKDMDGQLELLHINRGKNDTQLRITTHDGKNEKKFKGHTYSKQYVEYWNIFSQFYLNSETESKAILDPKRLIAVLQTLNKICGDNPVFLEFTKENNILIRSFAAKTGQRITGIITGVKADWVDSDEFTESLGVDPRREVIAPKGKPKKKKAVKKKAVKKKGEKREDRSLKKKKKKKKAGK